MIRNREARKDLDLFAPVSELDMPAVAGPRTFW
jgi:hypothetical protein